MLRHARFSALQRAEIAEITTVWRWPYARLGFSALQRAEIAEMTAGADARCPYRQRFSALQRAEIAEIDRRLLRRAAPARFSALQRAEIAEIHNRPDCTSSQYVPFQCSSTSRNC